MERYEAYKDSGVEWIGEIPEGWAVSRLKSLLSDIPHALADGPFGSDMKSEEYQEDGVPITQLNNIKDGVHKDDSFKYVSEAKAATLSSHYIYPGELLMAKMMPAGRTCIASSAYPKYLLSSDSIRIVPVDDIDRRFLCYAANAYANVEAELMSTGTTRVRINLGIVRNMQFAIPPHETQQAIADYLDAKTAEVDALVADCEREVGLLREYRKAVISEAVTKGLDPGAPMKDSGIEWIGNYPISWEYLKLGYTFDRLFDIDHWMPESTNEGYPYLMIGDLEELASRIDFESCKHISEEDYLGLSVKGTPKRGDVIIARYATIGTGCFVDTDEPFIVTYACLTVTPNHDAMRGRYLLYYTQSDAFERELYMLTNSNTQGNVGKDSLSKAHILLPPIDEQDEIVSALDASTGKIDELIQSKQSMADKLREYRRSLISEAVTGKFKVPGV